MNAEQIIATLMLIGCVPVGIWCRYYDKKWGLGK